MRKQRRAGTVVDMGHDSNAGNRASTARPTTPALPWPRLLVAAAVGIGLVVSMGFASVWAFNPVADEWHCSQGQAPARNRAGGGDCFREESALPKGYRWERWGNRPMFYNCDADGWLRIQHRSGNRHDCVREGTVLPGGWSAVAE